MSPLHVVKMTKCDILYFYFYVTGTCMCGDPKSSLWSVILTNRWVFVNCVAIPLGDIVASFG